MPSANGLGLNRKRPGSRAKESKGGIEGAAPTDDAVTDQLHQLYDSIAKEPIPDHLLDLLRKMKS